MLILKALSIYILSAFFLFQIQIHSPHLADNDPYYHIKLASIMADYGALNEMPWARFSLWSEYPYDKDFLFHLALVPFLDGNGVGELTWSAKIASALFGALLPTVLYLVIHFSGVKYSLLYTALLFLAPLSFTIRVTLLRPYLFSIIFCLLGVHFIFKRYAKALFVISILYALSYNTALLIPIFAFVFIISQISNKEKPYWELFYASIAGVIFGSLIHPNSYSLLANLYYQNILVLINHWSSNQTMLPPVEMRPFAFKDFIDGYAFFFIVSLVITFSQLKWKILRTSNLLTLQIINLTFLFLSLLSQRFVEYWIPFSIWTTALWMMSISKIYNLNIKGYLKIVFIGLAVIASIFAAKTTYDSQIGFYFYIRRPIGQEAATWMKNNIQSGETIFTCDWDDPPQLFLQNENLKYLVFADPSYMYSWRKDLWEEWRKAVSGNQVDYDRIVNHVFGANYLYCTTGFEPFWRQLSQDSKYTEVYKDEHAKIFKRITLE